jgi:SSS family solute:Na+ symporter
VLVAVALCLPLSVAFKYAAAGVPFLDRIALVTAILSAVIISVSLWEGRGAHEKGIEVSREEFRTDPVFTVGAIGSLVILAGLYLVFW